jgi:hypothetical protein
MESHNNMLNVVSQYSFIGKRMSYGTAGNNIIKEKAMFILLFYF